MVIVRSGAPNMSITCVKPASKACSISPRTIGPGVVKCELSSSHVPGPGFCHVAASLMSEDLTSGDNGRVSDISERLVDSLNTTYGAHAGHRAAHANGVLC